MVRSRAAWFFGAASRTSVDKSAQQQHQQQPPPPPARTLTLQRRQSRWSVPVAEPAAVKPQTIDAAPIICNDSKDSASLEPLFQDVWIGSNIFTFPQWDESSSLIPYAQDLREPGPKQAEQMIQSPLDQVPDDYFLQQELESDSELEYEMTSDDEVEVFGASWQAAAARTVSLVSVGKPVLVDVASLRGSCRSSFTTQSSYCPTPALHKHSSASSTSLSSLSDYSDHLPSPKFVTKPSRRLNSDSSPRFVTRPSRRLNSDFSPGLPRRVSRAQVPFSHDIVADMLLLGNSGYVRHDAQDFPPKHGAPPNRRAYSTSHLLSSNMDLTLPGLAL